MSNTARHFLVVALLFSLTAILAGEANATTQWSRKYGLSCNTCHNPFPRLNAYGELFLLNGYQDPDVTVPDGATKGKTEINDDTQVDKLDNFVGLRLNLTPIRMQTNALTVEGEEKTRITWGETNWFQVFYAGSINKNLSIFIESEFTQTSFKFNWYYLGIHRLFGGTMGNFQVGNISPLEFASFPNRLPQLPALKSEVMLIRSANGAGEDPVNSSSARHGIQWYGYKGPLVLWAGFGPGGSTAADVNDQMHYWAAGRFNLMSGALEGTNATLWYYSGTDAKNTATVQATSAFTRISPQLNVRMNALDVQFAYVMATEDNWLLVPDTTGAPDPTEVAFSGMTLVASYNIGKWYPGIQFDTITSDDNLAMERTYVAPVITYLWKENIRVSFYPRLDLREEVKAIDATADKPAYTPHNDFFINLRMMI